mgnify:CR=1 FL=1
MMAWRSETVMTFHIEPNPASMPNANQATGQLEVSASAAAPTAPPTISQGQRRTGPDRLAHPWCGEASHDAADARHRSSGGRTSGPTSSSTS